jgi:hypothetical protein
MGTTGYRATSRWGCFSRFTSSGGGGFTSAGVGGGTSSGEGGSTFSGSAGGGVKDRYGEPERGGVNGSR